MAVQASRRSAQGPHLKRAERARRVVASGLAVPLAIAPLVAGCEREDRQYRADPPLLDARGAGPQYTLGERYLNNAYHLSQGKRLYASFNCRGCHFDGGGGIGPALMENRWIYGGTIADIVATIREGRPNGMPSFRGKITDEQIWEIAAYVLSMSGNVSSAAAPNRDDHMQGRPAENRQPTPPPPGDEAPKLLSP
ncbi:MAG: cytochrome c [Methylobacteriaceae bacterium]|nr:cytochrome c [Methylobacteriaceae bacterium]MBV9635395.1 cytochrome c [Methylobacteriaceae bacterium]MBV9702353.1 cytochrome c [Methylobacteriaceae bacterium]